MPDNGHRLLLHRYRSGVLPRSAVVVGLIVAVAVLVLSCSREEDNSSSAVARADSIPSQPRPSTGELQVRTPAVAGSFYPADPGELRQSVERLLEEAEESSGDPSLGTGYVCEILVPHAGFVFSGKTAAFAYQELRGRVYDTVILLGSPHRMAVHGAAVYCSGVFETPLGHVPIDQSLAQTIVASSYLIEDDEQPHVPEHSLEVQLPFLQLVLDDFAVVPILVMGRRRTLEAVAQGIIEGLGAESQQHKRFLIVVSTDLSHYPHKDDAAKCDEEILSAYLSLDPQLLLRTSDSIMSREIPGLSCAMCGLDAAYVGMLIAQAYGARDATLVHRSLSSEAGIPGATARQVVGYGAVVIRSPQAQPARERRSYPFGAVELSQGSSQVFSPLDANEQAFLLRSARKTLAEYMQTEQIRAIEPPAAFGVLSENRGVFVSLYLDSRLRGCIGTHESHLPLYRTVQRMAVASAFGDPRFPALTQEELDQITIEISVYLSYVEPIRTLDQYAVERHGIIIYNQGQSATFLPNVASKQGWNKQTTLRQLCLKAGLEADAWRSSDAHFAVYETQVFHD